MVLRQVTLRARNGAVVHDGGVKIQTRKVYMESKMPKSKGDQKTYKKWSQIHLN